MADIPSPEPNGAPMVEPAPICASADEKTAETTAAITEVPTVEHSLDAPSVEPSSAYAHGRNPTGKKTDEEVELALVQMVESGMSVRESSKNLNLNLRTAYQILSRSQEDIEALRTVTRKVLIAGALERIDDWRIASEVGARKKGNHVPARDWLLHAGVIDKLEGDGVGGIRIAINIGTDEQPMRIRSPLRQIDEE